MRGRTSAHAWCLCWALLVTAAACARVQGPSSLVGPSFGAGASSEAPPPSRAAGSGAAIGGGGVGDLGATAVGASARLADAAAQPLDAKAAKRAVRANPDQDSPWEMLAKMQGTWWAVERFTYDGAVGWSRCAAAPGDCPRFILRTEVLTDGRKSVNLGVFARNFADTIARLSEPFKVVDNPSSSLSGAFFAHLLPGAFRLSQAPPARSRVAFNLLRALLAGGIHGLYREVKAVAANHSAAAAGRAPPAARGAAQVRRATKGSAASAAASAAPPTARPLAPKVAPRDGDDGGSHRKAQVAAATPTAPPSSSQSVATMSPPMAASAAAARKRGREAMRVGRPTKEQAAALPTQLPTELVPPLGNADLQSFGETPLRDRELEAELEEAAREWGAPQVGERLPGLQALAGHGGNQEEWLQRSEFGDVGGAIGIAPAAGGHALLQVPQASAWGARGGYRPICLFKLFDGFAVLRAFFGEGLSISVMLQVDGAEPAPRAPNSSRPRRPPDLLPA